MRKGLAGPGGGRVTHTHVGRHHLSGDLTRTGQMRSLNVTYADCDSYQAQDRDAYEEHNCFEVNREQQVCVQGQVVEINILFFAWVFCWVGASIPLYMLCCCTKRPSSMVCSLSRLFTGCHTSPGCTDCHAAHLHDPCLSLHASKIFAQTALHTVKAPQALTVCACCGVWLCFKLAQFIKHVTGCQTWGR
jgi:hypothetical protein